MRTGGTVAKTVAPEARFLRLLEVSNRACTSSNNNSSSSNNSEAQKIWLKRSGGDSGGVFRTPKENIPTVPITLADGSRVYVRCDHTKNNNNKNNNNNNSSINNEEHTSSKKSCSLGVSMQELFRRVDVMKRRNITNTIAAARRRDNKSLNNNNTNFGNNNKDDDDMLWVDKHAPASFPHLLSDEKTNREVLRTLRGWDPYVFNRDPPLRPLYQRQWEAEREEQKKQQQQQQQNNGSNNNWNNNNNNNKDKDNKNKNSSNNPSDKRPEENARVILLSGPPGVGK